MVVLKRLSDAERDGDRIYAVIKGVGGSSDGRALGLMAPLPAGQKRALQRAYAQADYSPATVELFEAHGTGTVAGDAAEIGRYRMSCASTVPAAAERDRLGQDHDRPHQGRRRHGRAHQSGSRPASSHPAASSRRRTAQPVAAQADSPLGLHQQARPWLSRPEHPRRAGVSSFGFGGTNFHVALEEYQREYRVSMRSAPRETWPAELFVWRAADRDALIAATEHAAVCPRGWRGARRWPGSPRRSPPTLARGQGDAGDRRRLARRACASASSRPSAICAAAGATAVPGWDLFLRHAAGGGRRQNRHAVRRARARNIPTCCAKSPPCSARCARRWKRRTRSSPRPRPIGTVPIRGSAR